MSNRAIAILVVVMAAWSFVEERVAHRVAPAPVVEEIHRRVALAPGAHVEVATRGGQLTVETADIEVAEIHVVRTGATRGDLDRNRLHIAGCGSHLVVRAESPVDASQCITLRLPRSVTVSTSSLSEG